MRKLFLTFLVLVIIILSTLGGLFYTQSGSRFTLAFVQRIIPGELHYEYVGGRIAGLLKLKNIHYRTKALQVRINHFSADWHAAALLKNSIKFSKLEINGVKVDILAKPKTESKRTPLTYHLPVTFDLKNIQLTDAQIVYHPTATRIDIDTLKLAADSQQHQFNITLIAQMSDKHSHQGNIVVQGGLNQRWDLNWTLKLPSLTAFIPDLNGHLTSEGKVTGTAFNPNITGSLEVRQIKFGQVQVANVKVGIKTALRNVTKRGFTGTAELVIKPLIVQILTDGKPMTFPIHESLISLKLNRSLITATADLGLLTPHSLKATLNLANYSLAKIAANKQTIKGKLTFQLPNLQLLTGAIPDIDGLKGRLFANISLSGQLNQPTLTGQLGLSNTRFSIVPLQLNVAVAQANMALNNNRFNVKIQLKSGKGLLNVTGNGQFKNNQLAASLKLAGNNVLVSNTDQYKLIISPNLLLNLQNNNINITGTVKIPQALLAPVDTASTVSLPADVIIIRKRKVTKRTMPTQLKAKVNLQLGDDIKIKAAGLEGKLIGALTINVDPTKGTTASGQLQLQNGTYSAYGRVLNIVKGSVNFNGGPINNPNLYIQASRTINPTSPTQFSTETIVVGVIAQGNLTKPKISLYSKPTLKQSDILSYLLFGQPTTSLSGHNASLLFQAASAVGGMGQHGAITEITGKVQKALGLSELGFQSKSYFDPDTQTTNQNTALVLGKRLNKRLFASYSIGLLDPVNTFSVTYTFNKNWALQTESNRYGNGADLLFTISK